MAKLNNIIELRKQLTDISANGEVVNGVLVFKLSIIPMLEDIEGTGIEFKKKGKSVVLSQLLEGDKLVVIFPAYVENYYEKFEKYIQHFSHKEPLNRYYIHDLRYDSLGSEEQPEKIRYYKDVVSLWGLLASIADHEDQNRLFMLSSDKLEIRCNYSDSDLRPLEKLIKLIGEFSENSASREEKRTIFKRALFEGLIKVEVESRFSSLIANFDSIYDRYWQNFRLFLEGISYESIFEGYVEKHSKLINELNSVLGGIQTAIIGLPIASFVLLEKITIAEGPTFKNTLLLLGCIVFVAFLFVLSFSQGRTLKSTKELSEELNDAINKKHPGLADKLNKSMARLRCHQGRITFLLWLIRGLLSLLVLASLGTYLYTSFPDARDMLNNFVQKLISSLQGAK